LKELSYQLKASSYSSTSEHDFTNALVADRDEIPAARFQNLADSFPREIAVGERSSLHDK